jgi:hypothetical protein
MKITEDVLTVLSAGQTTGKSYTLPTGQLDRALYTKVNKVLEAAGGKWDRKTKTHIFDSDAEERMDQILTTGEVAIPKDEFEFFPTPPAVVKKMHDAAEILMGMFLLEPSAGRGALIEMLPGVDIVCVEKMPTNADYLESLHFPVIRGDFLDVLPKNPVYDRVLMNPPFSKGQDVQHVTHALGFLKPGGRLVAIMGAGVIFRQDKRTAEFRELVQAMGGTIERLPEGSFKSSGTMVNTVIVVIDKQ